MPGMPALMPPHLWWWLLVLLVVYQGLNCLNLVAALVVGLIVTRMGYSFYVDSLHDLMDRAVDIETENEL